VGITERAFQLVIIGLLFFTIQEIATSACGLLAMTRMYLQSRRNFIKLNPCLKKARFMWESTCSALREGSVVKVEIREKDIGY
jgi:hypothetical protein